jgi:PAS domain S-box-containing protein
LESPLADEEMIKKDITKEKSVRAPKTPKRPVAAPRTLEDEEKYKAVFECAGDIILLVDQMGTITDVNKRLKEISGYNREELVGKNIKLLAGMMTAKSKAKILRNFQKRVAGVQVSPYEVELFKKNGGLLTFEVNAQQLEKAGKIIGDLVILRDITGRKQAEKAVEESEQNFRDLLDNSSMGVRIRDEDGLVLYLNQAFLDIFGFENFDEAKASTPLDHYTPASYSEYLLRAQKISRGEPVSNKVEADIMRKDGSIRHVQVIGQRVLRNGKEQGRTFYNDITAIKQAEALVKNSEQNLHNALDKLPMGFRITDIDDNTLYLNQAFLDIFGYENADEVRTRPPLKDFYTPESYAGYLQRKQKLLRGEPRQKSVEVDIIRKDGALRHLQLFTGELYWNGKKQFQTLYIDITGQKSIEMALVNSEQNLHNALDNLPMGIRIRDKDDNSLYLNQAFLNIYGYKNIEETRGIPLVKHYTPQSYSDYLRRREQRLQGMRRPDTIEVDIIRKDDAIRHLQLSTTELFWDGKPQLLNIFNDITERKQAEDALKASEENFRNSMDSSLMGIRIMGDADYTLYANQALLDMFGYKNIEELRASPPQEHYTPESQAAFVRRHEQFARGEPLAEQLEVDIIRADGAVRHLQLSSKNVLWNGKQQFQLLYDDITGRKQAEQLYHTLAENSPGGVYIAQDRKFVFTNAVFQKNIGFTADELSGISPTILVYPEDRDIVRKNAVQMLKGERTQPYVFRVVTKNGEIRWGLETMTSITYGGKRAMLGNFIDITERKQVEERLEQAAQEWRTTFDSITDLISIHDKNNRIVRMNKAYADLLKKTPQELVGKFCHEVMHGTQEPPSNCPHLQTINTGKPSAMEIYNPNFEAYFHELTSPLFNEKGEVTGSVVVVRDVTQQRRMEEQLILTDRLASIGELSSGIAHELNNPLTSVIGFSQLLMQGDVPDNIKEDLGIIYSEAQRAAVIVKNLLTFARKHAPVTQLSQVNIVIEDVLRLRSYEQKVNNVEIEKHLAVNLPEIMMDPFQIQQVFLNIIVNAEFAMLEAHQRGKLVITTEQADGVIRITFTDDGPGITEANQKRIFNPFFTTKEVGKGTGLGLSICHGIITEHGGKIYVRSTIGQGTAFIVELPLNG